MRARTLCLAVLGLLGGPVLAQQAIPDASRGQHLFMADGCYECHGTVGQGGAAGPPLAPGPPPAEAIAQYVRKPTGVMPPYVETVLGDRDVRDIQAWLDGLPQPRAAKDISLLAP